MTRRDPRVERSHERLREALLALTLERGWDAVSVRDVCERAGVGRSTFYVHFADREELLLGGFRREHVVPGTRSLGAPLAFVGPLVAHVGEQRALYHSLAGSSCERAVRRRFMHVITELVEAELAQRAAPSAQRTAAARYLTGAHFETLTFWLEQRDALPASEIERMLKQYSAPVLERVR
jgi:AcrR family transcriptional regulator